METILQQLVQSAFLNQGSSVIIGEIITKDDNGSFLVTFLGNTEGPQVALIAGSLTRSRLQNAMESGHSVLMLQSPVGLVIIDTALPFPEADRLPMNKNRFDSEKESLLNPDTLRIGFKAFEVFVAKIVSVHDGDLYIDFDGNQRGPVRAKRTIQPRDTSGQVLVVGLPDGDLVIIGQIEDAKMAMTTTEEDDRAVVIKGDKVRIEANQSITLLAGGVKVHLDARGKITTSADTIVSRARGANKVQGGSVQLN